MSRLEQFAPMTTADLKGEKVGALPDLNYVSDSTIRKGLEKKVDLTLSNAV